MTASGGGRKLPGPTNLCVRVTACYRSASDGL